MIWNYEINDPNLKYYLQKEQESWKQYQKYNEQYQQAMSKQSEQVQKLISENVSMLQDKKLMQSFSQQLQLCASLQIKFNKTLIAIKDSSVEDVIQLVDEIQESSNVADQDERIQIYIIKNKRKIIDAICEKYEEQMIQFLLNIGFPDINTKQCGKQYDLVQLYNYSKLTKHLLLIEPKFLWKLFTTINQHFDYHFIDIAQSTSDVSKPEWMFTYIYEKFQATICQLYEIEEKVNEELQGSIKNLAILMIKQFFGSNIQKRVKRDVDDFKNNPAYGLAFLEEAFIFTKYMNEFLKKLDLEYNFFEETVLIFEELGIISPVLEWEVNLFKQNILSEYEEKIKEKKIHEFLNLVEEFEIVWNSQFEKYKLIQTKISEQINQTKLRIFSTYLQLCQQYFKIIKQIDKKDYVQFLQTYYIGLKTIKKQFTSFKKQIKQLTNETLTKWLQPLSNQCAEEIFQQLYIDYLFEDKQFAQFSKQITKITLYQNHQIYFLQSQHEYAKKINNFYYKSNLIINHIIAENLTKKEYTVELQQKVARLIIRRLQELISSSIKKLEFTQEGLQICFMVIIRTTYFVILSTLNMEQHKYSFSLTKRFDCFDLGIRRQPPRNMNENDQQLIRNMKVIQI